MKSEIEITYTLTDIETVAQTLVNEFKDCKLFTFSGDLGTGKTTMIQALCNVLGCLDQVSSPTFSIVNEYNSSNGPLFHFDLYRLNSREEVLDIGFEDYIYSGNFCFIEWPEKVAEILPDGLVVACELSYLGMNERKVKACIN